MGAKLKCDSETTFAHMDMDKKDINLTNWRAMREWKHNGVDGLFVITKQFRMYFIPGYTMEMLHEANYCNKTLDIPYEFVKNVLSCAFCNGDGKTDWVEAARGPAPKKQMHGYRPNYYRARRGPIHIVDMTGEDPHYYTSAVYLHKGEEYCKKCHGCGLQLVESLGWEVIEQIYLDHS